MLAVVGTAHLDDCVDRGGAGGDPDGGAAASSQAAASEAEVIAELRDARRRNPVLTSMIGLGYYGTITPGR